MRFPPLVWVLCALPVGGGLRCAANVADVEGHWLEKTEAAAITAQEILVVKIIDKRPAQVPGTSSRRFVAEPPGQRLSAPGSKTYHDAALSPAACRPGLRGCVSRGGGESPALHRQNIHKFNMMSRSSVSTQEVRDLPDATHHAAPPAAGAHPFHLIAWFPDDAKSCRNSLHTVYACPSLFCKSSLLKTIFDWHAI